MISLYDAGMRIARTKNQRSCLVGFVVSAVHAVAVARCTSCMSWYATTSWRTMAARQLRPFLRIDFGQLSCGRRGVCTFVREREFCARVVLLYFTRELIDIYT